MREHQRRRWPIALLALLVGLGTACGDDNGIEPIVIDEAEVLVQFPES